MPTELAAAYDAFLAVLEELEPAKAALTEVLPGTRSPGRPLPDALAAFEAGMTRAEPGPDAMQVRTDALASQWDACSEGIRTSLAGAASAERADPAGFESLRWLVEALLDPLDPFVDAERGFLDLRR